MSPGPIPKRSDERRRRNVPAAGPVEHVDLDSLPDSEDESSLPFLIKQPIVIPAPPEKGTVGDDEDTDTPASTSSWHPVALQLWESFPRSGQALYWEPSDWAIAYVLCESLSRDLKPQVVGIAPASEFGPAEVVRERIPLKGASLGAYLKGFASLMLTEGDRRRLSIELERTRIPVDEGTEGGSEEKITDRRRALLAVVKSA